MRPAVLQDPGFFRFLTRLDEELARAAVFLADIGEEIAVTHHAMVLADEPYNLLLECAASGDVDAIVTGDKAMLRLARYEEVPIITLREFLAQ